MEEPTQVAGVTVHRWFSSTSGVGASASGPVRIRLGLLEALPWAEALAASGACPGLWVEPVGERIALLLPWSDVPSLEEQTPGPGEARRVFHQLALWIERLHDLGLGLRGLDPQAVGLDESLLVLPPPRSDPMWSAPEGAGPAADWYSFGLLLFHTLTGEFAFPDPALRHTTNGADPRDLRASLPDKLAALAMDLLLVDPAERPSGREVLDTLAPEVVSAENHLGWLDVLIRRGGLALRPDAVGIAAQVPAGLVTVGADLDSIAVEDHLMRADVLSLSERGLVATAIERPDALRGSARARAGLLFGRALGTTGVRLLLVEAPEGLPSHSEDLLEAFLRCHRAPGVVVVGSGSEAWIERLIAAGVFLSGDQRQPELLLAGIPYQTTSDSGLHGALGELRRTGQTAAVLDHLALVGMPWRSGLLGRAGVAVARLTRPKGLGLAKALDPSLLRSAREAVVHLALVAPQAGIGLASWMHTRALRRGDADSAALGALGELMLGQASASASGPLDASGQGAQLLGRALTARLAGDFVKTAQVLDGVLPLPGGGPAEHTLGTLMWLESLLELGNHHRAASVLRQARVDARRTGNGLLELGALCLGARLGWDVSEALASVLAEVDPGEGVLLWWVARARSTLRLQQMDFEGAWQVIRKADQAPFRRWPLSRAGTLPLEAAMWERRLGWAVGESWQGVFPVHPHTGAWERLWDAVLSRRAGDADGVIHHLAEGAARFEGAGALLAAAAMRRYAGLWQAGSRGGTVIEAADAVFLKRGAAVPAVVAVILVPELACPP